MGKGMSKVIPGLYVGCYADFTDVEQLQANKITHIISACDLGNDSHLPSKISSVVVDIDDRPSASISPHFSRCIEFIHKARAAGGAVLVHCVAGVSRSVTITAAYLLTISDISWRDAISCIKAVRNIARPNLGFQQQLQDWCERERWQMVELMKRWPTVPHKDREIIDTLMQKEVTGIVMGDEDFYPLAPGAYKQTDQSEIASKHTLDAQSETTLTKGEKVRRGMRNFLHKNSNSEMTKNESAIEDDGHRLDYTSTVTCSSSNQSFPSCHSSHVTSSVSMSPVDSSKSYQYVSSTEQLQPTASATQCSNSQK